MIRIRAVLAVGVAGLCLVSCGSDEPTKVAEAGPRSSTTSTATTAAGGSTTSTPAAATRPSTTLDASGAGARTVESDRKSSSKTAEGVTDVRVIHRPGEARAGTDSGAWRSMEDFLTFVIQDTAAVWNWYYQQWGRGQSKVRYYFSKPGEVVTSACNGGPLTDTSGPFYCGVDDTIYFSQVWAYNWWVKTGGDFGVVAALAHEYGHNVQAELGILREHIGGPKHEQDADCFSGAFAHVAYYQNILDANDINEGLRASQLVGDDGVSGPDPHGTPQERMNAFWLGYNADGPAGCDAIVTR